MYISILLVIVLLTMIFFRVYKDSFKINRKRKYSDIDNDDESLEYSSSEEFSDYSKEDSKDESPKKYYYDNNKTELHIACEEKNMEKIKTIINIDLNQKDLAGWSPLFLLAYKSTYDKDVDTLVNIAKILIENKADINARDKKGKTALMAASEHDNGYEFVKFLLTQNADIQLLDKNQYNVYDYTENSPKNRSFILDIIKSLECN